MRHKSKTILAALVAVLALGAVASASASAALPEFVDSPGEGFPIAVELPSNGKTTTELENVSGWKLSNCTGLKAKGELTGAKAASLTVELEKCRVSGGYQCTTVGAAPEHEVLTGTGKLVYINKATKVVGVVLTVTPTEIVCGEEKIKVKGGLIVPITPLNSSTTKLDLSVKGSGKGKQAYTSYENEKGEKKTEYFFTNFGTGYLESSLTVQEEIKLTTSKPVTIDA